MKLHCTLHLDMIRRRA